MIETAYATTEDLKTYAFQMGKGDDLRHEEVLPRASRLIDLMCGVPANFFATAGESAKSKTFTGQGTSLLRLPPYLCGSILYAEYATGYTFLPEYSETTDLNGVQWLRGASCFEAGRAIEITARWGWERVPQDIVEVTIELAIAIWRQRDGQFLRVAADLNGQGGISGQALPERVKLACQEWKRKRAEVVIV